VGRQRNDDDCLGRNYWRRLRFEHRRKILRPCIGSDTHANTFSDPNRDSYADNNCDSNAYGYSELHAEVSTDAAAAPDAGTSTVEVQKLKCNYENKQQT
jgi:hypothetical protein